MKSGERRVSDVVVCAAAGRFDGLFSLILKTECKVREMQRERESVPLPS